MQPGNFTFTACGCAPTKVMRIPFEIIRPYGRVRIELEVYDDNGIRVCGLYSLRGRISLPPKRWLRVVRKEMHRIEGIARAASCREIRLAGRNWSRVLPDYEPMPGIENRLRKVL